MPKKKSPPLFRPSTVVPILVVTFVLIYVIYSDNSSKNTPPDRTVTRVNSTGSVTPVSTPKPVTPPVTPTDREVSWSALPVLTDTESTTATGTTMASTGSLALSNTGTTDYFNTALQYGFSIPKWAYYAGFGARDGAAHSIGIVSGTGVTTFEDADVRLWFYPSKFLSELTNSEGGFYQDPRSNMTYLKLQKGTIKIEWDMESPIVLKLIETVYRRLDE